MRIGIISINAHTKVLNFASPLHSYVFQQYLQQKGFDATIIDYKPVYYGSFDPRHPLHFYQTHPKKDPEEQAALVERWTDLFQERETRFDKFEKFIQTHYRKTDTCYTPQKLDEKDPGFDCYICATDVIWKCHPNAGFDKGFFLACKAFEGKARIAYAASRGGVKAYKKDKEKEFLRYIRRFDNISVRERRLKEYIQKKSNVTVEQVLDPVFLQEKEFYLDLAVFPEKKDYVLIYLVMDNCPELVEEAVRFARERGLAVIELSEYKENARFSGESGHPVIYDIGIEEWLGYMAAAAYIFTNSFHGCCLSIIMEKQFFAGRRGGDKITNLLEVFGLQQRRIHVDTTPEEDAARMRQAMDFRQTDRRRREEKEKSEAFLLDALNQAKKNVLYRRFRLFARKVKRSLLP